MTETILILGACGQIGTELTQQLIKQYGKSNVVASDIRACEAFTSANIRFEIVDASDKNAILEVVKKYKVTQVYLLAAMLSATAEKFPQKAWDLNMKSLLAVLDLAKEKHINQVFWPSSIAAFGPTSPKQNTPQFTVMEPSTVYGISKKSGEFWCEYYHKNFGVDVRSLRYPGIISWKTKPGGGTTDYAVDIFFKAVEENKYTCFLAKDTKLPMMYMDDAIDATIQIMQAEKENIKIRTSYNLAAISLTPEEIAKEIQTILPDFEIDYKPDFRQNIAESWPQSIDDSNARTDWNWNHKYDLKAITSDILGNLLKSKNTLLEEV